MCQFVTTGYCEGSRWEGKGVETSTYKMASQFLKIQLTVEWSFAESTETLLKRSIISQFSFDTAEG